MDNSWPRKIFGRIPKAEPSDLRMERTWGRRIFGTVERGEHDTHFQLSYTKRADAILSVHMFVENIELQVNPYLYGETLEYLVWQIEKELMRINNTP